MSEIQTRTISRIRNGLQVDGRTQTLGAETITVLFQNESAKVLFAYGATLPTDATAGYAKGCIFFVTGGGVGTTVYANDGSDTSCDFNANLGGTGDITSVAAGAGLTGGGTTGALTMTVGAGTGIAVNADDVAIAAAYLPSHVVKYAGLSASETDSDASVIISVSGVASTDIVTASIKAQAGTATILKVVPTTNTITVTLSGNGGAGTIIAYQVLRAVA